MADRLREIIRHKAMEVTRRASAVSLRDLSARIDGLPATRGFESALRAAVAKDRPAVIAEVKKASPSKGVIRADFDPESIARSYASGGASCLSVLTDERFFQGADDYLRMARAACDLPVLRKEFIIDSWQVYETRVLGADCMLLIVAALGDETLMELTVLGLELGLDVLVEVHDHEEMERALATPATMIGINNRNLKTFETNIRTSMELAKLVPDERLAISESGIATREDVAALRAADIHSFLVGEAFMRQPDPGAELRRVMFSDDGTAS